MMMRTRRATSCPASQTRKPASFKSSSLRRSLSVPETGQRPQSLPTSRTHSQRMPVVTASTRNLVDLANFPKDGSQTKFSLVANSHAQRNLNPTRNSDNLGCLAAPLGSNSLTHSPNGHINLKRDLSNVSALQFKQRSLPKSGGVSTNCWNEPPGRSRQDSPDFEIVGVRPVQRNQKPDRTIASNQSETTKCQPKRTLADKEVPAISKRVKSGLEAIPEHREVSERSKRINMSEFTNMWEGTQSQKLASVKERHWTARGWSAMDYYTMALMSERAFPYEDFQRLRNKLPTETREVFRAVIETELLKHSYRGKGEARGGTGEERMREYKQLEHIQNVGKAEGWCEKWYWEQVEKSSKRTMEIIKEAERKLVQKETERIRASPADMKKLEKEAEDKIRDGLMVLKSSSHQSYLGQSNNAEAELKALGAQESHANIPSKCPDVLKTPARPARGRKPQPVMSVEEATDRWHEAGVELMKAQKKAKQQEKRAKKEVDEVPISKAKNASAKQKE